MEGCDFKNEEKWNFDFDFDFFKNPSIKIDFSKKENVKEFCLNFRLTLKKHERLPGLIRKK